MQTTQSTPNTPTHVTNTLSLNIIDPPTPPPNLQQSLPAHSTTLDKTIFPRPPTPLFSNTSAEVPLAQMIPQTKSQSHPAQISTFKPPIPAKTTTVKPSTANIQLHPTSISIIRPKASITTSSLNANFTKTSLSNSSQPYTIPQPNTMNPSPHE